MANVIVKGVKHEKLSKEEIRAISQASSTIMEFHNKKLYEGNTIIINVIDGEHVESKPNDGSTWAVGMAFRKKCLIIMNNRYDLNSSMTLILHEIIHLYMGREEIASYTREKCTSTLTNRLKPKVAELYEQLMDGIYQRAGYIAHTKISYKVDTDFYDKSQYDKVEVKEYDQYRRLGNKGIYTNGQTRKAMANMKSKVKDEENLFNGLLKVVV